MSVQVQEPQQRPSTAAPSAPTAPPESAPARPVATPLPELPPVATPAQAPAARRRPRILTRRFLLPLAAVILLVVALFAYNTLREGQLYVSTDNAQLTGQPVQVGAMNAGRVESIAPNVGTTVHKGDVIAQIALPSQVGMGQSGQPKMGFLGAGDTRVDV
jgi:hypothetical protein